MIRSMSYDYLSASLTDRDFVRFHDSVIPKIGTGPSKHRTSQPTQHTQKLLSVDIAGQTSIYLRTS